MKPGQAILQAFYEADGKYLAPELLRRKLGPAAGQMAAEIGELQRLGYTIEAHPHFGYRLAGTPDRLITDDIKARLKSQVIGSEVLVFEQTASTSDVVEGMARNGAAEGLCVFAETQSRGRGRHGRNWSSPRGKGLWFSVLLRPTFPAVAVPRLTVAASVAVALSLRRQCQLDARIKWPNDVMIRGKKVAGILTETRGEGDEIKFAVVGIGLNVNCQPADFPPDVAATATSVLIETGEEQDRTELAARLLSEFDDCYRAALADFMSVTSEWAQLCTTLGRQVVVAVGNRRIEGEACALHSDGALLVRKDNGQLEHVTGGQLIAER